MMHLGEVKMQGGVCELYASEMRGQVVVCSTLCGGQDGNCTFSVPSSKDQMWAVPSLEAARTCFSCCDGNE